MDLNSGYPFWAVRNGLMRSFPQLRGDLRGDVAIVGGGTTAALIADELVAHGHDVAVLEQRDIGGGSTAASTVLLQYEIDTHMLDLASATVRTPLPSPTVPAHRRWSLLRAQIERRAHPLKQLFGFARLD
jgi:glycine/D-amino acid oxidase-like deaminating enzyme